MSQLEYITQLKPQKIIFVLLLFCTCFAHFPITFLISNQIVFLRRAYDPDAAGQKVNPR